jgi:hypothetical protein
VEQVSQEKWQGVTHRVSLASELVKINFESLNLAVVRDEFDIDTFNENLDNEQHVEENDELPSSESDEENEANVPSSVGTLCDVPMSNRIDWGSYYIDEELMALKLKHINLQDYPNHKDISHIGLAVCDSAIVDDEGNPMVQEEVIKKN